MLHPGAGPGQAGRLSPGRGQAGNAVLDLVRSRAQLGDPYPGGPGQCKKTDEAWFRNKTSQQVEACVIAVVNWQRSLPDLSVNVTTFASDGALIATDIASDGVSILRFPAVNRSLMFASVTYREMKRGRTRLGAPYSSVLHQATTTVRLNRRWAPPVD
jgi:hypothetical protein